jgi:hypothetical protein
MREKGGSRCVCVCLCLCKLCPVLNSHMHIQARMRVLEAVRLRHGFRISYIHISYIHSHHLSYRICSRHSYHMCQIRDQPLPSHTLALYQSYMCVSVLSVLHASVNVSALSVLHACLRSFTLSGLVAQGLKLLNPKP